MKKLRHYHPMYIKPTQSVQPFWHNTPKDLTKFKSFKRLSVSRSCEGHQNFHILNQLEDSQKLTPTLLRSFNYRSFCSAYCSTQQKSEVFRIPFLGNTPKSNGQSIKLAQWSSFPKSHKNTCKTFELSCTEAEQYCT